MTDVIATLQNSAIGLALGGLDPAFGIGAQLLHISGLLLLLTPLLLLNLQLLGVRLSSFPLQQWAQQSQFYQWLGVSFLLLSGLFMWLPSATLYQPNPAFNLKIAVFILVLPLHFWWLRFLSSQPITPGWYSKSLATLNLALWSLVALAGRAIGYVAA